MPVLPWRSLAGLPRYAAGYSGMMELVALCRVPGGVALGRGTPFKAPSRPAGIGFGPQLSLSRLRRHPHDGSLFFRFSEPIRRGERRLQFADPRDLEVARRTGDMGMAGRENAYASF